MSKIAEVASVVLFWLAVVVVLSAFSDQAKAAEFTKTISWKTPETRVDGSKLKPAEIMGYDLRYGEAPEALKWKHLKWVGNVNSYSVTITEPGRYCYQGRTVDNNKLKSEWSKQACIDVPALPANPSTPNLEVTIIIKVPE